MIIFGELTASMEEDIKLMAAYMLTDNDLIPDSEDEADGASQQIMSEDLVKWCQVNE